MLLDLVSSGVLHIFGGIKTRQNVAREQSSVSLLLGIFETVLGLLLIIRPLARGPHIYLMASTWAFMAGLILIGDAIRVRYLRKKDSLPDKLG